MSETNIGVKIAELRKNKGISQETLAEKLNLTRQAISNWERGKSEPDINTLNSLAKILDTDLSYFVDDVSSREKLTTTSTTEKVAKRPILLVILLYVLAIGQSLIAIIIFLGQMNIAYNYSDHPTAIIAYNYHLLLFPVSSYGLLRGKTWGWWLSVIVYGATFWNNLLSLFMTIYMKMSTPPFPGVVYEWRIVPKTLTVIGLALLFAFFFIRENAVYYQILGKRGKLIIKMLAVALIVHLAIYRLFWIIFS